MKLRSILLATVCMPLVWHSFNAEAQETPADKPLINLAELDASTLKTENGAETSVEEKDGAKILKMKFPASKSYPGVDFKSPDRKKWDLSAYGGVVVEVTNEGSTKLSIGLRVDNPGDWRKSPWNSEVMWLAPGETDTITVRFGQSHGKPGYALDAAAVSSIKILVNTPKEPGEILIHKVSGVGK